MLVMLKDCRVLELQELETLSPVPCWQFAEESPDPNQTPCKQKVTPSSWGRPVQVPRVQPSVVPGTLEEGSSGLDCRARTKKCPSLPSFQQPKDQWPRGSFVPHAAELLDAHN